MAKYRWNPTRSVWQFWQESWGGWCVLREGTHESSRPMTYEQGILHLTERQVIAECRGEGGVEVVRYDDTRDEPSRAARDEPMSDSRDPKMNEAMEDVRELQESAAASFFALEDSLPENDATPTPPSSPPRAGEPTHYCATCWEFYAVEPTAVTLACPKCGARLVPRSSSPASGAPDEDAAWMAEVLDEIRELLTRYHGEEDMKGTAPMFYPEAIRSAMHKAAFGKLPREMYPAGSLLHRAEEAESRLAAAERAGEALREALREALEGNDAVLEQLRAFLSEITEYEHYYTRVVRFVEALEDNGQRIRAALTPPSPEERADG